MVAVYSSKAKIKPSGQYHTKWRWIYGRQYRQAYQPEVWVGREVNTTTIPARAGVRVNFVQENH